jgi:hypothetical protein
MLYTNELIRQELERYNANDTPISDDEVTFFKDHVSSDSIETIKDMLIYIHGRSWYWSRLMNSVGFPESMTPENLDNTIEGLMQRPHFVVGLHVAIYRLCGFKIEKEPVVKNIAPEPVQSHKPKYKGKKKE